MNAQRFIFKAHNSRTSEVTTYADGQVIPSHHLWAVNHLLAQDCGSISCGEVVYELIKLPANEPGNQLSPSGGRVLPTT